MVVTSSREEASQQVIAGKLVSTERGKHRALQKYMSLAGVAQWIERWPGNQRVTGSIPSLGHMPGLWARSPVWGV